MADDATSVGKIQLDIEFSKSSINTEMEGLNKSVVNSFKSTFSNMGNQMNGFVKNTLSRTIGSFKEFSQVGNSANKQISQSTDEINSKMSQLVNQMESATNRAELHRQKLVDLQALYDRLSNAGLGDSDKAKKLLDKITLAEDKVTRYGDVSDRTRIKIDQLEESMANLGETANQSNRGFKKAEKGADKTSRSFKILGIQADKSSGKVNNFATVITSSFMRVLKRIFILNLIYKAIRGLINYMNEALKTNKNFVSSLSAIKTNLKVAFQPIYDIILPALNALVRAVATVTAYIASAISALFGKSYKQSFGAAKGIESAKKQLEGYGGAAKKAAKDAKGALMGFDEINQLDIQDDEDAGGGSGGPGMEMPDTSTIDLTGLERFKDMLQPTIDSLKRLGGALDPLKNFVSQGLQDFYNNFLVPVGQWTLGEGLPRFIDAITKGLLGISWDTINSSLNGLWLALTPFAINVGEGLLWLWENVLTPLGTWVMNEIVPRFLDILAESFRVLNIIIETLKPWWKWLWDNFWEPLAKWTGGMVLKILDGINEGLKKIGDWISNNQKTVETLTIIVAGFAAAWGLVNIAIGVWNVVAGIASGITTAFGAAIAFLTSPIGIVIAVIGALIAVGVLLYKNWDEIAPWIKETWASIKEKAVEIWTGIKDFFVKTWNDIKIKAETIFNGIKNTIENIFNSVKTTISDIWNGITGGLKRSFDTIYNNSVTIFNKMKDFIKGITDSIEGFFKGMVNGVIRALNTMINGLNRLKVNIPDWVPGLGGKSLGFNIPNIPMLAKGGIIDQPTLAMVGERGKEAVIPFEDSGFLEALTGSIINGLLQILPFIGGGQNNQNSSEDKEIVVNLEGTPLIRILLPLINDELIRLGYRTIYQLN